MTESIFTGNKAMRYGSAIYNGWGSLTIEKSEFTNNKTKYHGTICNKGTITINTSKFKDNETKKL